MVLLHDMRIFFLSCSPYPLPLVYKRFLHLSSAIQPCGPPDTSPQSVNFKILLLCSKEAILDNQKALLVLSTATSHGISSTSWLKKSVLIKTRIIILLHFLSFSRNNTWINSGNHFLNIWWRSSNHNQSKLKPLYKGKCAAVKVWKNFIFFFYFSAIQRILLKQMVSATRMACLSSLKIMIVKMTEMCSSPMSKNPRQNITLETQVLKCSRNQFILSGYLHEGLCLPILFQRDQVWLQHNLHTVRHHIPLPQQDQDTYHTVRIFSSEKLSEGKC